MPRSSVGFGVSNRIISSRTAIMVGPMVLSAVREPMTTSSRVNWARLAIVGGVGALVNRDRPE
jgi:hypothetical protein